MSDSNRVTVPVGHQIFTTVKYTDHGTYCINFLARDWDDAKNICDIFGFSKEIKDLGTLEAIIEDTPDGLQTLWDKDDRSYDEPFGF